MTPNQHKQPAWEKRFYKKWHNGDFVVGVPVTKAEKLLGVLYGDGVIDDEKLADFITSERQLLLNEVGEKVMKILDTAELEKWFNMPDSTKNWKIWKKVRNKIRDEALTEMGR